MQYMKYGSFPWLPEEAALSIFTVGIFCYKQFSKRINKNIEHCHQYRITSFRKCLHCKDVFGSAVDHVALETGRSLLIYTIIICTLTHSLFCVFKCCPVCTEIWAEVARTI